MTIQESVNAVLDELGSARLKHPHWPADRIHAAAIVAEEAGELVQSTLQTRYEFGDVEKEQTEAIHTAATALRFW